MRRQMEPDEAKAIYHQLGELAEFSNTWIREKPGLSKFHMRGATLEAVWPGISYNVMHWIRMSWRQRFALAAWTAGAARQTRRMGRVAARNAHRTKLEAEPAP